MNFTPLKHKMIRTLLRRSPDLRDVSEKQWELAPAFSRFSPPAICLEGDLDLVSALMEDTTHEREMQRVHGGMIQHDPTIAYQLQNAEIADESVYKAGLRYMLCRRAGRSPLGSAPGETIDDAALACTLYGSVYFAHWMTDDLSLHIAAEKIATPLFASGKPWVHETGYCRLFHINRHEVRSARCKSLVVVHDVQNEFKRARYETIRSRLRSSIPPLRSQRLDPSREDWEKPPPSEHRAGRRILAISGIFYSGSRKSVPAGDCPPASEGACCPGHRRKPHGSRLLHSPEGGAICVIQPPHRFNNVFKDYTD